MNKGIHIYDEYCENMRMTFDLNFVIKGFISTQWLSLFSTKEVVSSQKILSMSLLPFFGSQVHISSLIMIDLSSQQTCPQAGVWFD